MFKRKKNSGEDRETVVRSSGGVSPIEDDCELAELAALEAEDDVDGG